MSFLTKRFIPPTTVEKLPVKKVAAREDPVKCQFDNSFVSVFRQLKASVNDTQTDDSKPTTQPNIGNDWLASLGTAPSVQRPSFQSEKPRKMKTQFPPFWRPQMTEEEKQEAKEKRLFVREDCKQQRKAATRKLKNRRL